MFQLTDYRDVGTLGGYPSPCLKAGESHPQTPGFVDVQSGWAECRDCGKTWSV